MLWNAYTELDKKLTRLSLSKCLTLAEILAVCMLNIILVPFCVVGFVTNKVMGVDACVPHPTPPRVTTRTLVPASTEQS